MKGKIFIAFLWTCLAGLLGTTSAYGQLDVRQLTEQQGLGNNTINKVHQDKKGFLWIGTDIGITRYDGNFFQTYKLSRQKGGGSHFLLLISKKYKTDSCGFSAKKE